MRKNRIFDTHRLVLIVLLGVGAYPVRAQGTFEDADKSHEFSDSTANGGQQQFDLRHTIPGEPEIDYPIYSAVPKTSFVCSGRHEGYYADIESRCQAFRICTHTARSVSGFGFLCPNGTLFSQKHFVCDWYRNVNCDESEQFYSKNDENQVGSSYDMMARVRQMMEYPMKTISKALNRASSVAVPPRPAHRHQNLSPEIVARNEGGTSGGSNVPVQTTTSRRTSAVTRDQLESSQSQQQQQTQTEEHQTSTVTEEALSLAKSTSEIEEEGNARGYVHERPQTATFAGEDVFVNSLGELSTDPGVNFDRTNAHIIAEPRRHQQRKMNFAQKVNVGLNDLAELPRDDPLAPEYVKNMRKSVEEAMTESNLAANVNALLEEVSSELETQATGYHLPTPKTKQSFRFLSRGFSAQSDRSKGATYAYVRPKQTESTVRFSPNELIDYDKMPFKSSNHHQNDDDTDIHFAIMTSTPSSSEAGEDATPPASDDSYLTAPTLPPLDDGSYLSAPLLEPLQINYDEEPEPETEAPVESEATQQPEITTVAPADQTQETTISKLETPGTTTPATEIEADKTEELTAEIDSKELEVSEVNQKSANLLLAGVKLTKLENDTEALKSPAEDSVKAGEESTTEAATSTSQSIVSTSPTPLPAKTPPPRVQSEVSSFHERIRSYRRLASTSAPLRSTTKTNFQFKRAYARPLAKFPTTTTTSSTAKPSTTTRSYLKRVAASRLRLSRLANGKLGLNAEAASTSTTSAPATTAHTTRRPPVTSNSHKNRHVDTSIEPNVENAADSEAVRPNRGVATWESVRQSLQRFEVKPKSDSGKTSYQSITTEAAATTAGPKISGSRSRLSNFKSQSGRLQLNKSASAAITTATTSHHAASSPIKSFSESQSSSSSASSISSLPNLLPLSFLSPNGASIAATSAANSPAQADSAAVISHKQQQQQSQQHTDTSDTPSTFLSFEKLTRSIVDDSILQNFRSSQSNGRSTSQSVKSEYQASASQHHGGSIQESPGRPLVNSVAYGGFGSKGQASAPTQRPLNLPPFTVKTLPTAAPTVPSPRIVVARAEGQRIESNSVSSIISSLVGQQQQQQKHRQLHQQQQPKTTPALPYVPLDDFLTRKFGNPSVNAVTTTTKSNYLQPTVASNIPQQNHQQQQQQHLSFITQQYRQPQLQQHQQQHIHHYQPAQTQQTLATVHHSKPSPQPQPPPRPQPQPQPQSQPQQSFQFNYQQQYQSPHQPQFQQNQHQSYLPAHQQSPQPQQPQPQQPQQPQQYRQSYATNIVANLQHQQQQLPQFPPLSTQSQSTAQSGQFAIGRSFAPLDTPDNHLNVRLPSLSQALIPAPTGGQFAQRRSDDFSDDDLYLSTTELPRSIFTGASSYDVPLKSIGRLPNDIHTLFRRFRKY